MKKSVPETAQTAPAGLGGTCLGACAGALLSAVFLGFARSMNLTYVNLPLLIGSAITLRLDANTWLLGFFLYGLWGTALGLYYAAVFKLSHRTGWRTGIFAALPHWLAAGFALGYIESIHPMIGHNFLPAGTLAWNDRWAGTVTFLFAHLLFGTIVGFGHKLVKRIYEHKVL